MFPRRKLISYLLLNAFVSACVTLSILYIYENNYRAAQEAPRPLQADTSAQFEIAAIIGAGLPDNEMILIRNTGQSSADLAGWQIRDADGNRYTFSAFKLPANAALQLHSAPGKDSVVDLYWGLSASVWSSDETASLFDPAGNLRSSYLVP
ncbi:MAG: lamin tail domain-containing protein [Anaerolineales bacterium]|nr:lamin tail domain-containing protein [Anaerolineales bacterium]